ncbi:MAG TPA: hypothetical protein VEB42_10580 [Chitinophagaceae bacterium]|nr:hypothetical protein [Chitinophagaceae bacterium]
MKIISTLKKTVTSLSDMLDVLGLNRNKPKFLYVERSTMYDPAGTPRSNVYRRDMDLSNGPAN